jgi:UDP-glucose:glycoprotein glucosyltransferase
MQLSGVKQHQMGSLLALDFISSSSSSINGASAGATEYALDIRDSAVHWINDIENDKQYKRWSSSLMELLRPTFPGMLRSVRKNIYNLVGARFFSFIFFTDFFTGAGD